MAKYSTFKYGDGTDYGSSAVSQNGIVTWILQVDWDDDGVFDGTSEAGRMVEAPRIKRGRELYLAESGSGFEHMRPGSCVIVLDNYDRRYDSRYASSPLYPNVAPGRKMLLRVRDNENDVSYTIFTGIVDDIVPVYGEDKVELRCVDYLQLLNDTDLTATSARILTTITGGLGALLDDVNYPGGRGLDTDTQPVIAFGPVDENAGQVAAQLADAALGTFFVDKEGLARFYARSHSGHTEHDLDQAQLKAEIKISQPWESVYNSVQVMARNQVRQPISIIYTLTNPLAISSGNNVTVRPRYNSSSDVQISSVAGNTAIDGSGSSITITVVSSVLSHSGGTVELSADDTGYVTELEISGLSFDESPEEFSETSGDEVKYGLKNFRLDVPYLQDRNYASEFVGILGSDNDFLYTQRDQITIAIISRPDIQYAIDLMDKINLTSTALDIDDTYFVLGIEHDGNSPQDMTTVLYLDKVLEDSTSITPASVVTIHNAPPGYNNPGGPGGGGGTPEIPAELLSGQVLHIASVEQTLSNAQLNDGTTQYLDVVFDTQYTDPDSMFQTIPSTIATIIETGYYLINISGHVWCTFSGAYDDGVEIYCLRSIVNIKKNGASYLAASQYAQGNLAFYGSSLWYGYTGFSNCALASLTASDTIGVYLGVGVHSEIPAKTITGGYLCNLTIAKVREA